MSWKRYSVQIAPCQGMARARCRPLTPSGPGRRRRRPLALLMSQALVMLTPANAFSMKLHPRTLSFCQTRGVSQLQSLSLLSMASDLPGRRGSVVRLRETMHNDGVTGPTQASREEAERRNTTSVSNASTMMTTSKDNDAPAEFGQVVRPRYLQIKDSAEPALRASRGRETASPPPVPLSQLTRRNWAVATGAIALGVAQYGWQYTHATASPVTLLARMQAASSPLSVIGTNGRPTLVDFWAPWCENCKLMAPTLYQLEQEYRDRVNFCVINGDDLERSGSAIQAFRVDAIPHLALVSHNGNVETALIGNIPRTVLTADLDQLIANAMDDDHQAPQPIPYTMYDAFAGMSSRKVRFTSDDGASL